MKHQFNIYTTSRIDEPVIQNRLGLLGKLASQAGYETKFFGLTPKSSTFENSDYKIVSVGHDNDSKSDSFIWRFFFELYISFRLMASSWKSSNECINFVSVPSLLLLITLPFFKTGKKLIVDIRDASWLYLINQGGFQKLLGYFFFIFAKLSLRKPELITTTNAAEYNHIINITKGKEIQLMTNGISDIRFQELEEISSNQKNFSKTGSISFAYIGNIGQAQKLDSFIKLITKHQLINLKIVGSGSDLRRLKLIFKNFNNIEFVGKIDWNGVKETYKNTDFLFARIGSNYETAVPSKIYEYISAGRPIIIAAKGIAADFSCQFYGVHIVDPDNIKDLELIINKIVKSPYRLKISEIKKNRELIEKMYIRDKSISNFLINLTN